MNENVVSFVTYASAIYRVCVNNKKSRLMTIIIGRFIYLFIFCRSNRRFFALFEKQTDLKLKAVVRTCSKCN